MADSNIKKGKIGNALESVAPDHVVAVANDIYDETLRKYQSELNQQIGQGGYTPPQGGIPKKDLASDVQASLGKADAAVPNTRTVNGKALSSNITLNASDVNALPSSTTIPTSLSQLGDDSTHRTVTDAEKTNWNDKYTKTEVDNMLVSAPEANVVVIENPSGADPTTLLPQTPAANTIYRVMSANGTYFSEYEHNGTKYVKLADRQYGIDNVPTKGSIKLLSSGGAYNVQEENEKRFAHVSEIKELSPVESKEGKFFYNDGERTNNACRYYKFEVIGGEDYLFSSYLGSDTGIPFLYWIDSNGTITSDIYHGNTGSGSLPVIYTDEPVTAPTGAVYACLNETKGNLSKASMKHKGNMVESIALKEQLDILTKAVGREAFAEMIYKEQLGVFPYFSTGEMRINAYMNSYIYEDIDPAKEYKAKDFGIPSSGYDHIANVLYYNGYTYIGYEADTYHEAGGPYYQSDYLQLNVPAKCTRIIITTQKDYTDKPLLLEEGIVPISSQELIDAIGERKYLPSCSLGDVRTNGTWLLIDSNTYTDKPDTQLVGWLRVTVISGEWDWILQEYLTWDGKYFKRQFRDDLTVGEWQQMSGGGNTYNVNNTFNNIQQTVNLTATPSITADTNNYLAPSGNASDRTADILTMLQSNGICRLGAGEYWIDSLVMPDNSSIIGSGTATKVYLKSGDNKFAIKMGKYCVVKDMALYGSTSAISVTETVGTRHGILWSGNYTSQQDGSLQPMYGTVSDVYISRFNGGGITCYDTGYGTRNYISATNVHIENCGAGINISYWSEFHKFTNVRCYGCYYGCINNGGNNMFVNCDFSSCNGIAFLMDNSQGQSPNNSHGSVIGCVFNHTANNTGVGIKILNCNNGFVFDGCQIFFSKIQIEDSAGIEVVSTNFGKNNCDIIIKNGGVILFANNLHQDTPPSISITNNNKVHFVNCYNRANGNIISA